MYDAETLLEFMTTIKGKQGGKARQLEIYLFQYEIFRVPKYGEVKVRFDFMISPENINGKDREAPNYREKEKKAAKLIEN